MYFLIQACEHSEILRIIYFGSLFLDLAFVLVPIGLIVIMMIDFTKAVITSKESDRPKTLKMVGKRIMFCILFFATPWIVSVFISFLNKLGFPNEYTDCLTHANPTDIAYYQELEDARDAAEKEKRLKEWQERAKENNNGSSGNTAYGSSYSAAAEAMLKLAEGELGHKGGGKYSGDADSVPWCAYFTMWLISHTEVEGEGTVKNIIEKEMPIYSLGAAGGTIYSFYKASNLEFYYSKMYGGDYIPKKGDFIYFRRINQKGVWNKKIVPDMFNATNHVGIVDYVEGDTIHTIEGNTWSGSGSGGSANNVVGKRTYALSNGDIMGYGSWYGK